VLLEPFLPFSSGKIRSMLSMDGAGWSPVSIPAGRKLGQVAILFERIDREVINEELDRLQS
jgi:methionyl-tRNA synthetase